MSKYYSDSLEKGHYQLLRWWKSLSRKNAVEKSDDIKEVDLEESEFIVKELPSSYRAQLRRCGTIEDILSNVAFHSLWSELPSEITQLKKNEHKEFYKWATIASALSFVKSHSPQHSFAQSLSSKENDQLIISELRFRQLQGSATEKEFFIRIRRILQQLNGKTNVLSLADDIACWFDEQDSDLILPIEKRLRVRWAMSYYPKLPKEKK